MRCDCIEKIIAKALGGLGRFVGNHPVICIILPILLTVVFGTSLLNIVYETNVEYLYTPINGENRRNGEITKKLFLNNVTNNFDPGRIGGFGQWAWIIILCKDNGSVLRTPILKEILKIDEFVQNNSITVDNQLLSYKDLCAKKENKCYENSIIPVARLADDHHDGTYFVKYPIDLDIKRYNYTYYALSLGGVISDEDYKMKEAKAIKLVYFLDDSTEEKVKFAQSWENKLVKNILQNKYENITITIFATDSIDSELHRIVKSKIFLYAVSVFFMVTFAVLTTVNNDWVQSKPWIGVFASTSCGLALVTGFGICLYCGVPYIHINIASGFLMLGIGMDDSFVILSAWRRTRRSKSVADRLGETYQDAAVSITITTLTNLISILIGIVTPFPSIRIFCFYTAITVLVTYIYQLVFVGGCLAICGIAEKDNRHSLTFLRISSDPTKNKNAFYKIFCTAKEQNNNKEEKIHFLMVFFRDQVGGFLTLKYSKVGIVFIFLAYILIAVWGFTNIKEINDIENFLPTNSYATDFFYNYRDYFNKYRDRVQIVINTKLDYSDPQIQNQVEQLTEEFENSSHIGESILTESWLRYYLIFLKDERMKPIVDSFNITNKHDFIKILRRIFLFHPATRHFKDDIVFNNNYTDIIASRFLVQTNVTTSDYKEKYLVQDLRDIAKKAPFPTFIVAPIFSVIDLVFVVVPTAIQTTSIAAAVMIIVCFLFIPNLSCAIWVAISVISIEIGVVGYMALWNVALDATSMVVLVMCIGFSVDYSAHISYSYIKATGDTPNEKMKEALFAVGMAIFQASFSTLIGVIFISFVPAKTFLILFKVLFLVVTLASLHGMVFLPVFLSLTDEIILKFSRGKAIITDNKKLRFNYTNEKGQPVILSKAKCFQTHDVIRPQVNLAYISDECTY